MNKEVLADGFVEPIRDIYVHRRCGTATVLSTGQSEAFARRPDLFFETKCACCHAYFPVTEFFWEGTNITVGSQ